jgi:hypothetical protein
MVITSSHEIVAGRRRSGRSVRATHMRGQGGRHELARSGGSVDDYAEPRCSLRCSRRSPVSCSLRVSRLPRIRSARRLARERRGGRPPLRGRGRASVVALGCSGSGSGLTVAEYADRWCAWRESRGSAALRTIARVSGRHTLPAVRSMTRGFTNCDLGRGADETRHDAAGPPSGPRRSFRRSSSVASR